MDLSIVIVSHNHAPFLPTCLESLEPAMQHLDTEVFVVDNCSTDGSAQLVHRHLPEAHLIVNDQRRGFAANNNAGIRSATGDFILLLNPDTQVIGDALETLVAYMRSHADVGICGAQLRFPDGTIQPSCRRFPTVRSVLARRTFLRRFLWNSSLNRHHLMEEMDHDQTQAVDWMLGACLLARREAIADVGLMDEGYFLYVEDIDWCYRMHRAGWNVCYVPSAQIVHHHLAVTDRKWLTPRTWMHFRSMARFARKHYLFATWKTPPRAQPQHPAIKASR